MKKFNEIILEETVAYGNATVSYEFSDDELNEIKEMLIDEIYEDVELDDEYKRFFSLLIHDTKNEELLSFILDEITGEDEIDIEEGVAPKKVKRDRAQRLKARREYIKNKSKIKRKAKRYRQTASYKQYVRKAKRMRKMGRTATGKRVKKYY